MRPLYESSADLANEQAVIKHLEDKWSCEMFKLPLQYKLDYAIKDKENAVLGFIEVKVRKYTMAQIQGWGGYMLSLMKWTTGVQLAQTTGLPFILVVKTLDGLYYLTIDPKVFTESMIQKMIDKRVKLSGRTDRGDWQDVEPCVMLDCNHFNRM